MTVRNALIVLVPVCVCVVLGAGRAAAAATAPVRQGPKAERFTLKHPEEIEGVPCAAGYLWRFPGGRLHRCTLDRDATVRGASLPKGSSVAFDADGNHRYVFLPRTTDIEGFQCRGSGHNFMTVFHPDGRLKLCWMPENRDVQGIPCAGFSIWADVFSGNPSGVYLHPNGQLATCRLSGDVTVGNVPFTKGSRIYLDAEGRPVPNPNGQTRR